MTSPLQQPNLTPAKTACKRTATIKTLDRNLNNLHFICWGDIVTTFEVVNPILYITVRENSEAGSHGKASDWCHEGPAQNHCQNS